MRALFHRLAWLVCAALFAAAPVRAETDALDANGTEGNPGDFFRGWAIEGSNTFRFDQYGESGPDGIYPDEGAKVYDEAVVNLSKQDGAYRRWQSQLALLLNDSEYRALDKGVVPERINITRVVGDRSLGDRNIPYRWEVGDYFSYFSYMTQQLSGKGAQSELQPGLFGDADSFVFFGGTNEARWQELEFDIDNSTGASYLVRFEEFGELGLHGVYNFREGDDFFGTEDQDQGVISSTYGHQFEYGNQKLEFEAEQALFVGDHTGIPGTDKASNRFGVGTMAELRGEHAELPFDYRIRGERYDEDFRPRGGSISSDRQSGEFHLGWRFQSGIRARARFQGFEDGFQQDSERRTTLGGVNLSGILLGAFDPRTTGTVDVLARQVKTDDDLFDTNTYNFRLDLGRPICAGWFGRFGFFADVADDRTDANADLDTFQLRFNTDYAFEGAGWKGLITPGLVVRFLRATNRAGDSDEVNPTLALRLEREDHSFGFNYGSQVQNRKDAGTLDNDRHNFAADYRFSLGPNTFGLEASWQGQRPDGREDSDSWKAGFFWTFDFAHHPAPLPTTPGADGPSAFEGEASAIRAVEVGQLAPGRAYVDTRNQLAALGVTGGERFGDYEVFELQVFKSVQERQRLVLVRDGLVLEGSAVVIDFDSTFTGDTAAQTFERVRKSLIDRYGKPTRLFELGEFGRDFAADVNNDRLIRITEWDTPSGVVRFGIPRRLDGTVRMEVQHAERFGAPRETRWSIEAVR